MPAKLNPPDLIIGYTYNVSFGLTGITWANVVDIIMEFKRSGVNNSNPNSPQSSMSWSVGGGQISIDNVNNIFTIELLPAVTQPYQVGTYNMIIKLVMSSGDIYPLAVGVLNMDVL